MRYNEIKRVWPFCFVLKEEKLHRQCDQIMAEVSGSAQDSGVETEGDQVTFEKLSVLVER